MLQIAGSIYAWIRMPNASGSARHHARVVAFFIIFGVNAVNYTVFESYQLFLNPIALRLVSTKTFLS